MQPSPSSASRLVAIFVLSVVSACACAAPPAAEIAAPVYEAGEGGDGEGALFAFSSAQFRDAFNRRAAGDGSDLIVDCVEVHWVMGCGFEMAAFGRLAPAEAAAAARSSERMPDEQVDVVRLGSGRVSAIDFNGNGSTPAQRAHYVGQMKTLLRVLSPGIADADVERTIDGLRLRASPAPDEERTRVDRAFASIACVQGAGQGAYINCSIAAAPK